MEKPNAKGWDLQRYTLPSLALPEQRLQRHHPFHQSHCFLNQECYSGTMTRISENSNLKFQNIEAN